MSTLTTPAADTGALPLTGRTAVILGASSGIGAATAEALGAAGAKVALLARRKDRLDAVAERIATDTFTAALDVTDADAVDAAAEAVQASLGRVNLVFNNAGVMLPSPVLEQRREQWSRQIDLNISGLMSVIGAFTPQLAAAAADGETADLINTSSIVGQNIFPHFAVYAGSKAFVTQLSRTLRVELGALGVRVCSLEPGVVMTELQDHVTDAGVQAWLAGALEALTPLQPEDIASVVTYLAGLPPHVNLQQVTVMPTGEAS